MFKECARLNVRGVVYSETLFLMVDPQNTGYGAKAQLNKIYPKNTCHQEYTWWSMPKELDRQKLEKATFKHVVKDVLTPYAVLFQAAIHRAEYLGYRSDEDVIPLIQDALEICYP